MSAYQGFIDAVNAVLTNFTTNNAIDNAPLKSLIDYPAMDNNDDELLKLYHRSIFNPTQNNSFGEGSVKQIAQTECYWVYHDELYTNVYFTIKHYGLVMMMFTVNPQMPATLKIEAMCVICKNYNLDPVQTPYKLVISQAPRLKQELDALFKVQKDPTAYMTIKAVFDTETRVLKCTGLIPNSKVYVYNITHQIEVADCQVNHKGNANVDIPYFYSDKATDQIVIRNEKQSLQVAGFGVSIVEAQLKV